MKKLYLAYLTNKKNKEEMPLLDHVQEFRKRLTWVVVVALIAFIGCFGIIQIIADHLLVMGTSAGFNFVYLSPTELISSYISLAFTLAIIITLPFTLFEIWLFVAPALTKSLKIYGRITFVVGFMFFTAGASFAYCFSLPFMLTFLVKYNISSLVVASISIQSYFKFIISTLSIFGLIFEMPLISFILSAIGILNPKIMRKCRQFAIPGIFVVAAIITPPDIVSQLIIGLPMIILYELSIIISAVVSKARIKKQVLQQSY